MLLAHVSGVGVFARRHNGTPAARTLLAKRMRDHVSETDKHIGALDS
jgi:hypothetical protein